MDTDKHSMRAAAAARPEMLGHCSQQTLHIQPAHSLHTVAKHATRLHAAPVLLRSCQAPTSDGHGKLEVAGCVHHTVANTPRQPTTPRRLMTKPSGRTLAVRMPQQPRGHCSSAAVHRVPTSPASRARAVTAAATAADPDLSTIDAPNTCHVTIVLPQQRHSTGGITPHTLSGDVNMMTSRRPSGVLALQLSGRDASIGATQ